ncbi:MAG TPA: ABC transporter permease [Lichenihabitans sp.]|jgi:peptide/nickel transport system permease protein|nr:ABC transporter permease [Lichenihabitans sp.]
MNVIGAIIAKRVGLGLFTLFVISLLVFFAIQLLPGDPASAILGQGATPEALASFRHELGLDQTPLIRYLAWASGLLHGDPGHSLANGRLVADLIGERLGNTVYLAAVSTAIAMPIGVALGVMATLMRGRVWDSITSTLSLVTISFPEFFIAYILVAVFSVSLGWLPAVAFAEAGQTGWQRFANVALPAITLSLTVIAYVMRMTRAALMNVMAAPYIEMAQLKGTRPFAIVVRHALPNALAPIINVVLLNLAYLIVGVVVVEVVFVYPGLGQLLVDSVSKRDLPVVQACCMIFAAVYVLLNLTADILAILSNPRLRRPRRTAA